MQILEAGETSGNRGNQQFGEGHRVELGFLRGRSLAHGVRSCIPLGPQPARPPQGPPWRSQPHHARAVVARPAGHLMGCPAQFRGVVRGRANVRSPRPLAAGAPASTPGDDRYASGGGRPGAPPPPGASDGRSGASRAARVGAGWMRKGAPGRGTSGLAPVWFLSYSPRSPLARFNLSLPFFCLRVPLRPISPRSRSRSLSLSTRVLGRQEAVGGGRDLAASSSSQTPLSCPSSPLEPGSPRGLLWGQGQGQGAGPSWYE